MNLIVRTLTESESKRTAVIKRPNIVATAVVTVFLRATAVPADTAERVLAMAILSVFPSGVPRHGTESSPGQIETPGFQRMIA